MSLLTEKLLNLIVSHGKCDQSESHRPTTRSVGRMTRREMEKIEKTKSWWSFCRSRVNPIHILRAKRNLRFPPHNLLTIRYSLDNVRWVENLRFSRPLIIIIIGRRREPGPGLTSIIHSFFFSFLTKNSCENFQISFSRKKSSSSKRGSERLFLLILNICYNFHRVHARYAKPFSMFFSVGKHTRLDVAGRNENSARKIFNGEIVKFNRPLMFW